MASEKGRLWFHTASVGEFNTAKPLLRRLFMDYHITLTYFSFRAREYLRSQQGLGYFHDLYRLPPDLPPLVSSFERRVKPDAIFIMERELWPSLLLFTKAPKVWLNAYAKGGLLERWLSRKFSLIVAREEKSARVLSSYGCNGVLSCGNLKFVLEEPPPLKLRVEEHELLIAGSTHRGEEVLIGEAFRKLKREFKNLRLVVAPRHVSRAREVGELFKDFRVSFRSEEEEGWEVLVVDTLGELFSLYALARVAFVGGTLLPVGGHNLLEPAYFGKPVLYGPYTHKVEDIRGFLEERSLGFCIRDAEELYQKARSLLRGEVRVEPFSMREYSERTLNCYLSILRSKLPSFGL
ncbi:MAG: glycosyltransferase N-terminal domain-containing protein [Aquificaceae bacterium]|nr:glycosyltransferase N-terminal domain-containing protein [Aquificaceae bacterium]